MTEMTVSEQVAHTLEHDPGRLRKLRRDNVAAHLAMSESQMCRELRKEGTSYKEILKSVRVKRLNFLIKEFEGFHLDGFTLGVVNLGYLSEGSFYRAFQGWTGMTWREYKRDHYGEAL